MHLERLPVHLPRVQEELLLRPQAAHDNRVGLLLERRVESQALQRAAVRRDPDVPVCARNRTVE